MYQLALTLDTPAANVALDEALLAQAEAGRLPGEVLRIWESPHPCVVLGRSSPAHEVHVDRCREDGVAVVRRPSGGSAVAAGRGCLMYALVLDRRLHPELRGIDGAHNYVLDRILAAVAPLASNVLRAGTSDLALPMESGRPPRKFSGNSLRVKREHLLYHGTILYDFPLDRFDRWLATPVRQPKYRQNRRHSEFTANLSATRGAIETALVKAWRADAPLPPLTVPGR
jgi:lipoate-protein ligase A